MSAAIAVKGVTKRYGEFVAVDSLSFEVPRGVIYGFLGPNGAGKTTTLRMINNINAPDEGSIEILGQFSPGAEAAKRIGYLPEERGLYTKMNVREVLAFFAELRGVGRRESNRRASEWLEKLGIGDWADNKVEDLSKGMQQKVQFATTLLHEPELLILDEPWSGLDPINADVLRQIVLDQKAAGKTILFSTHLMEQAEKLCDHVFIIAGGRQVLEGELNGVKEDYVRKVRRVVVEFEGERDDVVDRATLSGSPLIADATAKDEAWHVELAADASASALLESMVSAGHKLRRYEVFRPSLHDIFVERVEQVGPRPDRREADDA